MTTPVTITNRPFARPARVKLRDGQLIPVAAHHRDAQRAIREARRRGDHLLHLDDQTIPVDQVAVVLPATPRSEEPMSEHSERLMRAADTVRDAHEQERTAPPAWASDAERRRQVLQQYANDLHTNPIDTLKET